MYRKEQRVRREACMYVCMYALCVVSCNMKIGLMRFCLCECRRSNVDSFFLSRNTVIYGRAHWLSFCFTAFSCRNPLGAQVVGGGDVTGTDPAPQLSLRALLIVFTTPAGGAPPRPFLEGRYLAWGICPVAPLVDGLLYTLISKSQADRYHKYSLGSHRRSAS